MSVAVGSIVNNRYEVLQEVGEGGFAWVYKARDNQLGRIVALKILKSHKLCDDDAIARFQRESVFLAKLLHPHIVQVYAFEILNNSLPCMVMEYLDGQSLAKYLRANGKLTPAIFNHVILPVCSALSYAHKLGFVHRDLTPSNILLIGDVETCDVKIIDFGLSKILHDTSNKLTQTGLIIGTPAYMSPDIVRAQGVDQRSDIYSLGCVMYEALSGKAAFSADSPVSILMLQQHQYPSKPDLGLANAEQEKLLSQIILKCLQKNTDQRFGSCDEIANALIQASESGRVDASVSKGWDINPWAEASKKPLSLVKLFALLFLIIGLVALGVTKLIPKVEHHHETSQSKAASVLKAQSVRNKENLYASSLKRAEEKFGVNSMNLLTPLTALAKFYRDERKFAQAESLMERVLAIQEKSLGPNDVALADTLDCLSQDCLSQNHKSLKAELLAKRSLAISERFHGNNYVALLSRLEELAVIFQGQGRYAEAEPLLKRCLVIRENAHAFGTGFYDLHWVADGFSQLAKTICKLKRFAEAEALFKKAIALNEANVSEKKMPSERISDIADGKLNQGLRGLQNSYVDLADCYLQQKTRIKEAESLIKKAMPLMEEDLSPHRDRMRVFLKLSWCYRLQGKLKEAEPLAKRALAISSETPDMANVDRGWINYELATCYFEERRLREAEPLYKRALAIIEDSLGPENPDCDLARQGLLRCCKAEGKNAEAESLLKRVPSAD